ncbi:MAG: hypothetical protein K6A63_02105 [Acholeplasmatales bacterium]|nr:hypothetical protein [Acholeplasmatales bacterium]
MKEELLTKPLWDLKDIKTYFGCGNTRASQIMQEAKKISVSRLLPSKAKRDNVFQVLGISFMEEVKKIKMLGEN